MSGYTLTHLKQLEAESIHIIREVAAEFEQPGDALFDRQGLLRAWCAWRRRRSIPAQLPFPLLHVDTTWKFREMIAFRDRFCREHGLDADRAHESRPRERAGINPFDHGSKKYTDVMKTEALKQALNAVRLRRGLRRRASRRGEEPGQGARLLLPRPPPPVGPEEPAAGAVEPVQRQGEQGREHPRLPAVATGPSWTSGNTSTWRSIPIVPLYFAAAAPGRRARRHLIMVDDERMRLHPGEKPTEADRALPHARLLPAHRRRSRAARRRCRRSSRRCCSPERPSARAG